MPTLARDLLSLTLPLLLCALGARSQALKNDATEVMYGAPGPQQHPEPLNNSSLNRARNGGKQLEHPATTRTERGQVGCRELRSTKYISDGQCTSINPVKELVCAGECLPAQVLPNWITGGYGKKFWARQSAQDWRCVTDKTRTQRIQLQCQNGTTRTYKITVVTSCKCKRYSRQHNESAHKFEEPPQPRLLHKVKAKTRHGRERHRQNWHEAEPKT